MDRISEMYQIGGEDEEEIVEQRKGFSISVVFKTHD